MSTVQLGLLFATATPFAVAAWVAARRSPRIFGAADFAFAGAADDIAVPREMAAPVVVDVEPVMRAAADAVLPMARAQYVRVELAVNSGIKALIDPPILLNALWSTARNAVRSTPGGNVLISGVNLRGQPRIMVMDDGANFDQAAREDLAREAQEMIVPRGGSILVETKPGYGTRVTLRLPPPTDANALPVNVVLEPFLADQAA